MPRTGPTTQPRGRNGSTISASTTRVAGPRAVRRPLRLSARAAMRLSWRGLEVRTQAIERGREQRRSLRARVREARRRRAIAPTEDLVIVVLGDPKPQGSLDVLPSASTGRMVAKHPPGLLRWRARVRQAAAHAMRGRAIFAGPLELRVIFWLARPKSLPRRITHPERKPDLDKLLRAIGDALEGIVYLQDAQITSERQKKRFSTPPRCEIRIGPDRSD